MISEKYLKETLRVWAGNLSYTDEQLKKYAHRHAKKCLKELANLIGCRPGDYEIRSNLAGIAVSGEVTLHSNPISLTGLGIYVQIGNTYPYISTPTMSILYRSCRNLKDYSGNTNHWITGEHVFASKEKLEDFARLCRQIMG